MNPTRTANESLKHNNPQFYMGKAEVRSCNFVPRDLTGVAKSTLWAPSSFSLMHKNKHFQAQRGQRAVLMCFNALHCDFIAHIVVKSWNH